MPTISMFYGIIIRMYCAPSEHSTPHIHAYYQNQEILVNITDNTIMKGQLPIKKQRMVMAWVDIHQDALLADWELAASGEPPFNIEPLR